MWDKKRLRNYAFWASLMAQLLIVVQLGAALLFGYSITDEFNDKIMLLVNAVLVVLSTLGIISNPTKPESKGYNL